MTERKKGPRGRVVTRRNFLRKPIVIGTIAGLGLLSISIGVLSQVEGPRATSKAPENPQAKADLMARLRYGENILEGVIAQADSAIDLYEAQLTPRLPQAPNPLRTALVGTIEFYKSNRNNPLRNDNTRLIAERMGNVPPQEYTDPNFSITLLEPRSFEQSLVSGIYYPSARALGLRGNIQGTNLMDASTIDHEVKHALQDLEHRKKHNSPEARKRYLDFFTDQNIRRIPIEFEYEAFAGQIEALNLLTDGRLKIDSSKNEQTDTDWYMRRLAFRPEQKLFLLLFVLLAKEYYGSNSSIGTYNTPYREVLNENYLKGGKAKLYQITDASSFQVRELP